MVTLVIDSGKTEPAGGSKLDAPADATPDQPPQLPPLVAFRCAVEMVCVGLIFALFLLRGLDAVIHG